MKDTTEKIEQIKCSACGKKFDLWDCQEDFSFDKFIGFGSMHDGEHIVFQLCCECFDKVFDKIKPMIKDIKIEDYDDFEGQEVMNFIKEKNLKEEKTILGAIIGDIVGSRFEFSGMKNKDFELLSENNFFTDDTVMTCAIAKALLNCDEDYYDLGNQAVICMQELGNKYVGCGYGSAFLDWLGAIYPKPYNSFGNGSAMRVSPVSYVAKSLEEAKILAKKVTEVTHNHIEGIKGGESIAVAIWMALNGYKKDEIRDYIKRHYYHIKDNYEDLPISFIVETSCQETVPLCFYAFFKTESFEDAIRAAVAFGGDADTMGAITGSIAGAYYGVPKELIKKVRRYLSSELLEIIDEFEGKFNLDKKEDKTDGASNH